MPASRAPGAGDLGRLCGVSPCAASCQRLPVHVHEGDSYWDTKTYRCHLSPQTSWLHPPQVTMGAVKLCQNSHLIRTSEWKLRICAISTLSAATSPSFPAFPPYFIILQTHRLDSPPPTPSPFPCPCPAALRRACPRPQWSH